MEYTTILYVIYNDGTAAKKSMYQAESSDLAIANAHKYMGQYMAVDGVASCCTMAINSIGGIYANYHWTAPVVESAEESAEE